MFNLGFGEILIICAVLIIVVGPERLPTLMKNVGKTLRTVRQASRELQATVGLDEILRDDITRPLPPPKPRIPPTATVARDPVPALPAEGAPVEPQSELAPAVSPVLPSSTDDGSPAPDANAVAAEPPAPPVEPFAASGSEYNKKTEQSASAPTLAEADGLSISERMLLLHMPKPAEPSPTPSPEVGQGSSTPAVGAGAEGQPGGGKGEA